MAFLPRRTKRKIKTSNRNTVLIALGRWETDLYRVHEEMLLKSALNCKALATGAALELLILRIGGENLIRSVEFPLKLVLSVKVFLNKIGYKPNECDFRVSAANLRWRIAVCNSCNQTAFVPREKSIWLGSNGRPDRKGDHVTLCVLSCISASALL